MDYALTPTSIHRKLPDQPPEIVDIETPEGERALLLFASPEIAESFRENTGRYPDFMGFKVSAIDHDAIRALTNVWRSHRWCSMVQSPTLWATSTRMTS